MKANTLVVAILAILVCAVPSFASPPEDTDSVLRAERLLEVFSGLQSGDEDKCHNCELLFLAFTIAVEQNSTIQALIQLADKGCAILPPSAQPVCDKIAKDLIDLLPKIAKILNNQPYGPQAVCAFIGFCTIDCCVTDSKPEQIHLAVGANYTEMSVTWVTQGPADSVVQYGPNGDLSQSATGTIHSYNVAGWNGTIHVAVMTDLLPNTTYSYIVGSDASGWSDVAVFRTENPQAELFNFAVIGDMGLDNSANTTVALTSLAKQLDVDMLLHIGDISYADGAQTVWDQFMRMVQPITASLPWHVVPGNHEIAYDFTSYRNRFFMPGHSTFQNLPNSMMSKSNFRQSLDNMFYSFNYGPIHFVGFSTESDLDVPWIDPTGFQWLELDLQEANHPDNRAVRPWIIVMGHRPLYCSNTRTDCGLFAGILRGALEKTFLKYQVDVMLNGHVHNYERTYPVAGSTAQQTNYTRPTAPVYITNGAAGNREGLNHGRVNPIPAWSAVQLTEFGYGMMAVTPTTLRYQFVRDSDFTVLDDFTISKV